MTSGEHYLEKPSTVQHGDRYVVRIYTDESLDPHVYNAVKHVWHKNGGRLLVVLHYLDDGSYRYVCWPTERIAWFQVTPERFETQVARNEREVDRR
jgi:hypothetical protein